MAHFGQLKRLASINFKNLGSVNSVCNKTRCYTLKRFGNDTVQVKPKLLKPFIFTLAVGTTSYCGCALLQYELAKKKINQNSNWKNFKRADKSLGFRRKLNQWWNNLHEGEKIAVGIIAINTGIFLLWQIPTMKFAMYKWFTSAPSQKASSPLLLSCFSHQEIWHIGCNMFVLWSFAPLIQSLLGTEQFLAFYVTGGTVSSLASYYFKIATKSKVPSLGASGALLAVLAACCIERPDARLSILFLPFFSFTATTALFSIIALDITGILMRWKLFDHAGHLGGTLFGSWYTLYGHKYTWDQRIPLVRWWHEFRKLK